MKNRITIFFISIIIIVGCKKETNKKDECGCNGVVQFTIPENEPMKGDISYKKQLDTLDDFYNNKYWLGYTEQNCSNCIHSFILCNDKFLPLDLKKELLSGQDVTVIFSGYVTETCIKLAHPADYTYNHIILTKIEKNEKYIINNFDNHTNNIILTREN